VGYLVDGANFGGRIGGPAGARDAPGAIRHLLTWARERRTEVVVGFDGPPRPEVAAAYGALSVQWSGTGTADDRIVALVTADPRRWVVVTADLELSARCRGLGARVAPAAELIGLVRKPSRRPPTARQAEAAADKPPPHAEERDYWRSVFEDLERGEAEE
jgi:hypothetical protein